MMDATDRSGVPTLAAGGSSSIVRFVRALTAIAFAPMLLPALAAAQAPQKELTEEEAKKVDLSGQAKPESILADAPPEAPPEAPRRHGFVIESSLGAMGFAGRFGNLVPPAFWLHTQLGYEIWRWFMVFAEAEMAFTQTSLGLDPSKNRVVPIFGFGGGLRVTLHFTERVAMYVQGNAGAIEADVPRGALAISGFADAESFGPYFGGRLGLEWYQVNPHIALALSGGPRAILNFSRAVGSDLPLAWDAQASLRYTF